MPICCVCDLEIDHVNFRDPNGYLIVVSVDIVTMKPRIIHAHNSCAVRAAKTIEAKL